jgi:putative ABC transport system substrate-binding protein
MFAHQHPILAFADTNRLPVIVPLRHWASAGALITFSPDLRDQFRRVGLYVVKILKGAQPADLPVEQPTKFELILNLKTARRLGLEIPLSLQAAADEVIE